MAEKTAKSNKMKMYPFAFLQPYSVSEQVLNGLLKTCSRYFRKVSRYVQINSFKILSEKVSKYRYKDTGLRQYNLPTKHAGTHCIHVYLLAASVSCIFCTIWLYLLSLNIISARSMLNVQHMPRSVGRVVKIAEHCTCSPIQ